jgi:hypothetical protein
MESDDMIDDYYPVEPLPPGGKRPDLNLAGASGYGFNVASGVSFQSMPDPGKPAPYDPVLNGGPENIGSMGINPMARYIDLNLAGSMGTPSANEVASPTQDQAVVTNDYIIPDMCQPSLQAYNLDAGISHFNEFQPDPAHPDLTEYCVPGGLTIHNYKDTSGSGLFVPDPPLTDLINYDVPSGIDVMHHPLEPDPGVPDLQQPELEPEIRMDPEDRPGELDDEALSVMHALPTYQTVKDKQPETVFMDQSENNSRRTRKFTTMMKGLDAEEANGR